MTKKLPAGPDFVDDCGPRMLQLPTDRMRRFVQELLLAGDNNATAAAGRAGYAGPSSSLAVQGHRLIHRQDVLRAMKEEAERHIRSGVLVAASVFNKIAADPSQTASDRMKAADRILSGSGLGIRDEKTITVIHSDAELISEIRELALALKVDPTTLLGVKGTVTDAEFKVLDDDISDLV